MDQRTAAPHTSQQILDIAQRLVQTRGFNAFSYADIAEALKITTASLHYHFASKASLGVNLIERYTRDFSDILGRIDAETALGGGRADQKLQRYAAAFADVLADDRSCMCGMLAAEFETLPKTMQVALEGFFVMTESWLEKVLEEGRATGSLHFRGSAHEAAQYLNGSLEGSMIMARSGGGMARFDFAIRHLLEGFGA